MSKTLLSFLGFFCPFFLFGQIDTNSSGFSISNSTGSISYSIGQVFYEPFSNNGWNLFPGVQQVYLSGDETHSSNPSSNIELKVYPTLIKNYVELSFAQENVSDFSAVLMAISGEVMRTYEIDKAIYRINTEQFPSGLYILQISGKNGFLKNFKLIKNEKIN